MKINVKRLKIYIFKKKKKNRSVRFSLRDKVVRGTD